MTVLADSNLWGNGASEGLLETELLAQGPHVVAMLQNEQEGRREQQKKTASLYFLASRLAPNVTWGGAAWQLPRTQTYMGRYDVI
jgi:hypothetical protein